MSKARRETNMLQVLGLLERAGELARAAEAHALLARRIDLAHHRRLQRARAGLGKRVLLRALRPLLRHDAEHLRDHVAGALDRHGVADAHVEPRDLVGVVQRRVLHHHAADRDRLELRDRRERAGAPDLDLDVAHHRRRLLGRELVRDRPARACARRSRAAPASRAGRPCRRRRRCRSRACRASSPISSWNASSSSADLQTLQIGLVWKPQLAEPLHHAGLRVRRHLAHLRPTHRRRSAAAATP